MGLFFDTGVRCPCEPEQKDWIDSNMGWLITEFGIEFLRDYATILPTSEFFPFEFNGSTETATKVVETVCIICRLNPEDIEISFYSSGGPRSGSGMQEEPARQIEQTDDGASANTHEKYQIYVPNDIADAIPIIAVVAHELADVLLIDRPHDEDFTQPLSDLLTVFLGFGIFNGDAALMSRFTSSGRSKYRSIERIGFLNEPMFAYALALYAFLRREDGGNWIEYMGTGLKADYRVALRYLLNTQDTPLVKYLPA